MKKWVIIVALAAFVFGTAQLSAAAYEFYGIISQVKGKSITVKNSAGKTKTVKANGSWQVGDKVKVRGNTIETWDGNLPSAAGQAKQLPKR